MVLLLSLRRQACVASSVQDQLMLEYSSIVSLAPHNYLHLHLHLHPVLQLASACVVESSLSWLLQLQRVAGDAAGQF